VTRAARLETTVVNHFDLVRKPDLASAAEAYFFSKAADDE
jgi:hypothetical protein